MQREVLVKEASNLCLYINATQLLDVGAIASILSAVKEQLVVPLQPAVLETVINERLLQLLCLRALKSEPRKQHVDVFQLAVHMLSQQINLLLLDLPHLLESLFDREVLDSGCYLLSPLLEFGLRCSQLRGKAIGWLT